MIWLKMFLLHDKRFVQVQLIVDIGIRRYHNQVAANRFLSVLQARLLPVSDCVSVCHTLCPPVSLSLSLSLSLCSHVFVYIYISF